MRRRDLLFIGAALTLPACSTIPGAVPRPSIPPGPTLPADAPPLPFTPPGPDAVPKSFLATPQWPNAPIRTRITALHRHHLCAAVLRDKTQSYPVVVDVTGPTTRVVLSDASGTFTTRDVELDFLAEHLDPTVEQPDLGQPLVTGPAIMDDDHAYLLVIRAIGNPGVAHLLKITLSDGVIAASALLSEWFDASLLDGIFLSFSPDGTSLLVVGSGGSGTTDGFIGMRLDATDLSVQFDAHDVLTEAGGVGVAGEALTVPSTTHRKNLVLLADGREILDLDAPVVIGPWCYHRTGAQQVMLRDLTTGEETPVPDLPPTDLHQLWPRSRRIWSTSAHRTINHRFPTEPERFSVWLPGESAPVLQWRRTEHPIPDKSSVFGNTLYSRGNDSMEIRSLGSGEVLGSIPSQSFNGEFAVSSWGAATTNHFSPANEWF